MRLRHFKAASWLWMPLSAAWLASACWGLGQLLEYAAAAGTTGMTPHAWPTESTIPRTSRRATLVVFIHPRCPCSRATLGELARLLANAPTEIGCDVAVALFQPSAAGDEWRDTSLHRLAQGIPTVRTVPDRDGAEARRFGAITSGHVVLYGSDGALRFSGGITPSRGHEGHNAGRAAILAALARQPDPVAPGPSHAPVFGCAMCEPCPVPEEANECRPPSP